jgi:hypothetical protein
MTSKFNPHSTHHVEALAVSSNKSYATPANQFAELEPVAIRWVVPADPCQGPFNSMWLRSNP